MSGWNGGTAELNPQANNILQNALQEGIVQYDETRIDRMYSYPATQKRALMHKKANQFGYNSKKMSDGKPAPLCPCCELPINTMRIGVCYGTTPSKDQVKPGGEIFLLNAGSAMFFTFIKMSVVYLILRFIVSDCYNLISNRAGSSCNTSTNQQNCQKNIMATFSTYNKGNQRDEPMVFIVDILNLATIVVSIIFFLYYRRYQYRVYAVADAFNHVQSEYTVFLQNIPVFLPTVASQNLKGSKLQLQCDYENQLKALFEQEFKKWIKRVKQEGGISNKLEKSFYDILQANPQIQNGPKVMSISLCFDLTEMEKLNEMRQQLMKQHNSNINDGILQDENSIYYIPTQIDILNEEYIKLSKRFSIQNSASFNLSHFLGQAFVSFQYEHYKQYTLEYLKRQKIEIQGKTIRISQSAEPSDIYWFNMKIRNKQRNMSVIYSFFILSMALATSFFILFQLQLLKNNNSNLEVGVVSYLFTFAMTTLTTTINQILAIVIQKLTEWEKHKTKTDYVVSLMIKTIIAQFVNTAVIYYIISVFQSGESPLNSNGLVMQVTSLIAISGGIQIALNIFQPGTLIGKLLNWWKYHNKQDINLFQIQLNKELQDPEFDFSSKYAYYIVNVYIVSFYAYITPYISLILAIIFIVQYWVDKYNLFQVFSCPIDFNYRLSRLTIKAFQFSIFVFALGNILFSFSIHVTKGQPNYHIINWISLGLALAYIIAIMFLPKSWFQKFEEEEYQKMPYSQCLSKEHFNKVYWLSNPATNFAKEVDLNDKSKFVNYGSVDLFADADDYDEFIEVENKGEHNIEKYTSEQVGVFANAAAEIAKGDIMGGLVQQNADDEIKARMNNLKF